MISAWAFLKSLRDKHIFGCRKKSGGEVGGGKGRNAERESVGGRKGKGGGNDSGNGS